MYLYPLEQFKKRVEQSNFFNKTNFLSLLCPQAKLFLREYDNAYLCGTCPFKVLEIMHRPVAYQVRIFYHKNIIADIVFTTTMHSNCFYTHLIEPQQTIAVVPKNDCPNQLLSCFLFINISLD
jgi:hypothetical protein